MTDQDREFLTRLCAHLEERFPGVVAAHEGFVKPYLGGDRDGFLVVEVFNVPEDQMEEVLREGEALTYEHLMKGGGFATFSLWTPEETRQHFQHDLRAIADSRVMREAAELGDWLLRESEVTFSEWSSSGAPVVAVRQDDRKGTPGQQRVPAGEEHATVVSALAKAA